MTYLIQNSKRQGREADYSTRPEPKLKVTHLPYMFSWSDN